MAAAADLLAADADLPAAIKSRKSPQQLRAQGLVEAILEAAARILETDPAGFTTNHVAVLAGVSIGSLYQYFPNKDALVAALITRSQAEIVAAARAVAADPGAASLAGSITALIEAGLDHQLARPQLAVALDNAERALPVGAVVESARAAIAAALAGLLRHHGIADAQGCAEDLLVSARALIDQLAEQGISRDDMRTRVRRAMPAYLTGDGASAAR